MTYELVPVPTPKIRRILWVCTFAVVVFLSFTAGYMVALWPAPASSKPPNIPIVQRKKDSRNNGQKQPIADPVTTIPATSVYFHLVKPDKEKRSGLYAMGLTGRGQPMHAPDAFTYLADGTSPPVTTAHRYIKLIGRLPGTITDLDFFRAEKGSIGDGKVDVRAKFVRYVGLINELPAPRVVYVEINLPVLPAGKYRAQVLISDYIYRGERSKIEKAPPTRPPTFLHPLVCEFEVKPPKATAAKTTSISWGKAVEGLRIGLSPANITYRQRDKEIRATVWYENERRTPKTIGPDSHEVGFTYDGAIWEMLQLPTEVRLQPGERARQDFRLRMGMIGTHTFVHPSFLAPGDSLPLRAALVKKGQAPKGSPLQTAPITITRGGCIAWGETSTGLQAGLHVVAPAVAPEEGMQLDVYLRNRTDKPLEVLGSVQWQDRWRIAFTSAGRVPRVVRFTMPLPKRKPPPNLKLVKEGRPAWIRLSVGRGEGWIYEDARPDGKAAPLKQLPPGKYDVTATHDHIAGHPQAEACPCWHGKVTTGAVEIEIKPKAKVEK